MSQVESWRANTRERGGLPGGGLGEALGMSCGGSRDVHGKAVVTRARLGVVPRAIERTKAMTGL